MSGAARDRFFFLRPEQIEQLLLCDFSDDDEEAVTNLDTEDVLFLENDALGMQDDEPIEVIIEGSMHVDHKPAGTVDDLITSNLNAVQEPIIPMLFIPPEKIFCFRQTLAYKNPVFIGLKEDCAYKHSQILKPVVHTHEEIPSVYGVFNSVCNFEVNIISISYGAFNGWPSASFMELQSSDSPLQYGPITALETSWIGSILCVGGLMGTLIFSWSADKIGRKRSLIIIALPALLGWWIIPFAKNPLHLAISRFLGGFSGGGSFVVIPVYTTEISEVRVRGKLGTLLVLSCNIGMLFAFLLGNFFSYSISAWILSSLPLTFLLTFMFLPESPQHLMNKDKVQEAEKSMCFFRSCKYTTKEIPQMVKTEIEKLMEGNTLKKTSYKDDSIELKDFVEPKARKAFTIGIALMAINQFCGCFAMLNYTATIFEKSASNLTPNKSAIIVGAIQLLGSYMSTILVERAGRKVQNKQNIHDKLILLTISAIGTGIGLVCLGSFMYLNMMKFNLSALSWIPVASFSFTIFIACWGVLTLPFVVVSEIMPPKIRNIGSMMCMLTLWLFSYLLLKYMTVLSELLELYGLMFAFATCCFVGAGFIALFVPETKEKAIN